MRLWLYKSSRNGGKFGTFSGQCVGELHEQRCDEGNMSENLVKNLEKLGIYLVRCLITIFSTNEFPEYQLLGTERAHLPLPDLLNAPEIVECLLAALLLPLLLDPPSLLEPRTTDTPHQHTAKQPSSTTQAAKQATTRQTTIKQTSKTNNNKQPSKQAAPASSQAQPAAPSSQAPTMALGRNC